MNGYNGKLLRVNLATGDFRVETPDPFFYRRYAGGRNFGAYFLLNEVSPGADPLGPENKLIFAVSMLTGTTISGQSRSSAVGKSPLTGGWGEAEAGGFWPAEFKAAGFDALIVEGCSPEPCYLWIKDGVPELRPAHQIWGKDTKEAEEILKAEVGDARARVCQIGIAGENLVRYACIVNDLSHFYGRSGLGAVMGAKKLRAIVVRGKQKPQVADAQTIRDLTVKFNKAIPSHPALSVHQALGTSKGVAPLNAAGMLPTHNFRGGSFEEAEGISGERMQETILLGNDTCFSCATRCKRVVGYEGPEFKIDPAYGGPEYETIGLFGSGSLVGDIKVVAKANELCNRYGIDTISCAMTIACAMDCFEHGLLKPTQTDGIDLRFGNGEAILACIEKIARRDGVGDLLAEGSRRMAQHLGGDALRFAMQVKGQELPAHEPRGKWGVALGYGLSPTGGDHLNAAHDPWFTVDADPQTAWVSLDDIRPLGITDPVPALYLGPEKVRLFTALQNVWSLINVIDFCLFDMAPEFSSYQLDEIVRAVRAVTGWNTSLHELLLWGERGVTLARAFNAREGMGFKDDMLPDRLHEPLTSGVYKGVAIPRDEYAAAVRLYYAMRGWDNDGKPTAARLHWLDLGWVTPLLTGLGQNPTDSPQEMAKAHAD
jgi:aldehyde:ferredoxin oxidoreductase